MNETTYEIKDIPVHKINDERTQSRVETNQATVDEYAEAMKEDNPFPALIVFYDAEADTYWLGDGFHRLAAAKKIGCNDIKCKVHPGVQRDALLHSLSANIDHGLRRTNEDKRKAVMMAIHLGLDNEMSDREVAKLCGVSNWLVSDVKSDLRPKVLDSNTSKPTTTEQLPAATSAGANDDEPDNVNDAELSDDLPEDATDFDSDKLEGQLKGRISSTRLPKSGTEVTPSCLRKEAEQLLGQLTRKLDGLKIRRDVESELEAIRRRIYTADEPAREMKDGSWVPINGPAEWRDGDWHEIKDDGTEGFGAWRTDGSEPDDVPTADDDDEGWGAPEPDYEATPMEDAA